MNSFKRFTAALVLAGVALFGVPAVSHSTTPSASAATVSIQPFKKTSVKTVAKGKVKVSKIATKSVSKGKKVKIVPKVSHSGKSKIVSKKLNVVKGKKYVAKNKSSVSLAAGKYRVTSTVKYKIQYKKGHKTYWSKTKTKKVSQSLTVKTKPAPKKQYSIASAKGQEQIVSKINSARAKKGLHKLKMDSGLNKSANFKKNTPITVDTNKWNPYEFYAQTTGGSTFWADYTPSVNDWWSWNSNQSIFYKKNATHIGLSYTKNSQGYPTVGVIVAKKVK